MPPGEHLAVRPVVGTAASGTIRNTSNQFARMRSAPGSVTATRRRSRWKWWIR